MKIFDFSDSRTKEFQYQKKYYEIYFNKKENRWNVTRYKSLYDYARPWGAPGERICGDFSDPHELLKTVTIEGLTLESIIKELDDNNATRFEYNYERFLIDTFYRQEFGFFFRDGFYYIDYWESNVKSPAWIPGWIFAAGLGGSVLISKNDFDTFIHQVDLWMIKHTGVALKQMFNEYYKDDQTGELRLECIYLY